MENILIVSVIISFILLIFAVVNNNTPQETKIRDIRKPFNCDSVNQITKRLFLSNYAASLNYDLLKSLGINQILSVGIELPPHKTTHFKTMHLPLDDTPKENISKHFEEAHKFINKDITLVHCYAGISRSATIVISYLMKYHKMSLNEALEYCRSIRPIVNPNKGFINQLIEFEKKL
jgi:hypothetical protein